MKEFSMEKLRVGVLMGGKSIEHEVSFNSGRTVCDHLDTAAYTIVPLYQTQQGDLYILPWHFLHRGKTSDFVQRLKQEAPSIVWDDLKDMIDFMFLAIHGRYAEDGTVQGFLEVLGIPYLGSGVFASALCMDKVMQKNVLKHAGIPVPNGIVVYPKHIDTLSNNRELLTSMLVDAGLQAPYIVKPSSEGSSIGVYLVNTTDELIHAIQASSQITPQQPQPVLIEEKVTGMEFSCVVIRDYISNTLIPMSPTEIAQESEYHIFDYEQKYMPGKALEYTPARCGADYIEKIQDTCCKVTELLEVKTVSRVDGFLRKDGSVVIFEANTITGMGPTSFLFREAAELGMSHTGLINHLIKTELYHYGMLNPKEEQSIIKHVEPMNTQKIRVAVLFGGQTHEKEISLESGRNVVYKLSPHKYQAIPVFVSGTMDLYILNQSQLVRNSTMEIEGLLGDARKIRWADLPSIADFVFIGLHGGKGENGSVQGTLEMLGLPYNGSSVLASALCMDKYKTNEFLRNNGFDVPKSVFVERNSWEIKAQEIMHTIVQSLGFPLIVKPHDDGCSTLVQKVKDEKQLRGAIEDIFNDNKTHALIEECIHGMELTVGVIGNENPRALPASQAVVSGDILSIEEKFLPGAGENQTPAPLSDSAMNYVQKTIENVYTLIGCKGYARIDCFYQDATQSPTGTERVVIIEVNTLPGLTPATCIFHQAAEIGIKPMDFIDLIVALGFEHHKQYGITQSDRDLIDTIQKYKRHRTVAMREH
jgi:D-alanine--D-alanine ligase